MKDEFSELLDKLKKDILALARKTVTERAREAQDDAEYLLDIMKLKLREWTVQLAEGSLSKDDFEYHVKSQKDLMSMFRLKQTGISKAKADKFREDVFVIITSGVLKFVGL
jgi:hypothetical protein